MARRSDGRGPGSSGAGTGNGGDVLLSVVVQPGARHDEVVGWQGDALKLRVRAAAEQGRANRAVEALLARSLGVPASGVHVVSGAASRSKRVRVIGIAAGDVADAFGAPAGSG